MSHSAERWLHTEAIFHEAVAITEPERTAFLEAQCGSDTELMAELRALLEACEEVERRTAEFTPNDGAATVEGQTVGPYALERLLGRGGMGAVYLAHRADGQFEQQVAIKIIDMPLATNFFQERFRTERQILAGLSHPYIAHLLDGGVTEAGELYLAMEYIDGISITQYCDQNKLSIHQRLLLFKKVCEAVQYAHQNLIVHRDLKPDNILVTSDGTPRLLDFGTAKILTPLVDGANGELTRAGFQAFTPRYASPEQVLGQSITTASDIYSLGVLLYRLLTKAPPYELTEFTMEEMLRVICNEQPLKPSAAAAVVGGSAAERIDADLDAIVLKALRKEPHDRYATVDQFASDIQAYLDKRPVMARRGTFRYKAGKFVRRNKLAIAAAALLFATLSAGVGGILWQRRKVEARSEDLRQLSNSLLSEIDDAIKELPGSTPVQHLLVQRVVEHLDRMSQDAAGDRQTGLDLIGAYTRLGNVQGNIYEQNIGDPQGAMASLDKALAIAQVLRSSRPKDAQVLGAFGLTQQSRSDVLLGMDRDQEAFAAIRSSVEAFDEETARKDLPPVELANAAVAYSDMGDQLGQPGFTVFDNATDALNAYQKSLNLSLRALSVDPNFIRAKKSVATEHIKIGNILVETDPVGAIAEYQKSLEARDALPATEKTKASHQRMLGMTYWELGVALTQARYYQRAIAEFDRARETMGKMAAADQKNMRAQYDLSATQMLEGLTYVDMTDPVLYSSSAADRRENAQKGLDLLRKSAQIKEQLLAVDPKNDRWKRSLSYTNAFAGTLEQALGDQTDGIKLAADGVAALRKDASANDATISTLDDTVTVMLKVLPVSLRDTKAMVGYAERLVTLDHRRNPGLMLELAQTYRCDGQSAKAVAAAKEGLALLPPAKPGDPVVRVRKLLEIEAGS